MASWQILDNHWNDVKTVEMTVETLTPSLALETL